MTQPRAAAMMPSTSLESSLEYEGGIGGLYVVRENDFDHIGTVAYWKLSYRGGKDELLGAWQEISLEAERLWLRQGIPPEASLNIVLFRNNLIFIVGKAALVGIKDVEEQTWRDRAVPWRDFEPGPWVFSVGCMVPPIPPLRSSSWDRAVKEHNRAKMREILMLANEHDRARSQRQA